MSRRNRHRNQKKRREIEPIKKLNKKQHRQALQLIEDEDRLTKHISILPGLIKAKNIELISFCCRAICSIGARI